MRHLNIGKLRESTLQRDPFSFLVVPAFLAAESVQAINATYPTITRGGSYPIEALDSGMTIKEVIEELDGVEFEHAVGEKFSVDLAGKPKIYSLRGYLRAKDGKIHTDSKDKIITVLLYLNESWSHEGGRLRLLRSATDLESHVAEIPPDNGTLLIFQRADNSWHGHYPFEGQRRTLQMNWMSSEGRKGLHAIRHNLSAALKRLMPVLNS